MVCDTVAVTNIKRYALLLMHLKYALMQLQTGTEKSNYIYLTTFIFTEFGRFIYAVQFTDMVCSFCKLI